VQDLIESGDKTCVGEPYRPGTGGPLLATVAAVLMAIDAVARVVNQFRDASHRR
jgi:hypothetical protein